MPLNHFVFFSNAMRSRVAMIWLSRLQLLSGQMRSRPSPVRSSARYSLSALPSTISIGKQPSPVDNAFAVVPCFLW